MTRRVRIVLACTALAGLGALFLWSFTALPSFGHYRGPYGSVLNRVAVPERHTTNVVAATVFDYRGFDTLGEELILLTAVVGVTLLLRGSGEERGERRAEGPTRIGSDMVTVVGTLAVGAMLLVGLWLVAFGYVTPGGGFQGGVVIAGGVLLVYAANDHRTFEAFGNESVLDPLEATGAAAYMVVGVAALVSGLAFLHMLLGLGVPGTLWSGGSIALLNWATALEVSAANVILFKEFLDEYLVPL